MEMRVEFLMMQRCSNMFSLQTEVRRLHTTDTSGFKREYMRIFINFFVFTHSRC